MGTTQAVDAAFGWSDAPSPHEAIDAVFGADGLTGADLGIVFASADYDLDAMGSAIAERFPCPVIGCTTAGEISADGYRNAGVSMAALRGVDARLCVIEDLDAFDDAAAAALAARLGADRLGHDESAVMITLFDGLSMCEEGLTSRLYAATGGVAMVGGSAGDSLSFAKTGVYCDGAFREGIATCALVRAPAGLRTFIGHHYEDTGAVLVVTAADPANRRIVELNGLPAARAYAEALGKTPDTLTASDELLHPLMVKAGERMYVRGVQKQLEDGSLQLYCAIDEGVVLHVGESRDVHPKLRKDLADACAGFTPELVLMFDCITRRLEATQVGSHGAFCDVVSGYPSIGFSTYGEQFNGVHVNQTMTGVVFGRAA